MPCVPRYAALVGSPFQPGHLVRIVQAIDPEVYDVSSLVGRLGKVVRLDDDLGTHLPEDPLVHVRLTNRECMSFFVEELALLVRGEPTP